MDQLRACLVDSAARLSQRDHRSRVREDSSDKAGGSRFPKHYFSAIDTAPEPFGGRMASVTGTAVVGQQHSHAPRGSARAEGGNNCTGSTIGGDLDLVVTDNTTGSPSYDSTHEVVDFAVTSGHTYTITVRKHVTQSGVHVCGPRLGRVYSVMVRPQQQA
jgi:hypothetical protein